MHAGPCCPAIAASCLFRIPGGVRLNARRQPLARRLRRMRSAQLSAGRRSQRAPSSRETSMQSNLVRSLTAAAAVMLLHATPLPASAEGVAAALTGVISSDQEGAMEGVVVSAKKAGSIIK